jgi:parvulin-like peptidyl-prolyl isomerase
MHGSSRRIGALAAAAVLLALAGCSGGSEPAAITVNGQDYSRSSVERELDAIVANEELRPFVTRPDGRIQQSVARTWLTGLVEAQVAEDEVGRRDLPVSDDDRTIAEQRARQLFGKASIFDAFPRWFRAILRDRYANAAAVVRANADEVTDDDVRAQYEQSVTSSCASHRFVSHILVASEAEAKEIAAQLAQGADFGVLASQRSTDQTSGRSGGDLGCLDGQELDPAFSTAANALPLGQVSAPVQSQFGWHLIVVRDIFEAVPYEAVQEGIRNDLETSNPAGRRALERLMRRATVKVAKQYGRWSAAGDDPPQVKARTSP